MKAATETTVTYFGDAMDFCIHKNNEEENVTRNFASLRTLFSWASIAQAGVLGTLHISPTFLRLYESWSISIGTLNSVHIAKLSRMTEKVCHFHQCRSNMIRHSEI